MAGAGAPVRRGDGSRGPGEPRALHGEGGGRMARVVRTRSLEKTRVKSAFVFPALHPGRHLADDDATSSGAGLLRHGGCELIGGCSRRVKFGFPTTSSSRIIRRVMMTTRLPSRPARGGGAGSVNDTAQSGERR